MTVPQIEGDHAPQLVIVSRAEMLDARPQPEDSTDSTVTAKAISAGELACQPCELRWSSIELADASVCAQDLDMHAEHLCKQP